MFRKNHTIVFGRTNLVMLHIYIGKRENITLNSTVIKINLLYGVETWKIDRSERNLLCRESKRRKIQ